MNLTKEDKKRVMDMVKAAMDVPADDGMVAAMFSAYKESVAVGETPRDPVFEQECTDHLRGTEYE